MGLTIADLEYFTFSGIIDLIDTFIDDQEKMNNSRASGDVRPASQADIDRMLS